MSHICVQKNWEQNWKLNIKPKKFHFYSEIQDIWNINILMLTSFLRKFLGDIEKVTIVNLNSNIGSKIWGFINILHKLVQVWNIK